MGAPPAFVSISGASRVHWPETYFESRANAEPGTFQVTCRGSDGSIGDLIRLYVNGENVFTGFVLSKTTTTWQPDKVDDEDKTILQGADLNILLDRLIVYNHEELQKHPTGGGAYLGKPVVVGSKTTFTVDGAVPPNETVAKYLENMMKDTDYADAGAGLKLDIAGVTDFVSHSGDWFYCHNAGTTLRALFSDTAAEVSAAQPGSIIFYIAPDGRIVFHNRDTEGGGAMSSYRSLSTTIDASNVKSEAFAFAGQTSPIVGSKQVYLLAARKKGGTGLLVNQYSEPTKDGDWSAGILKARVNKIIAQQSTPGKTARWQQFSGGLKPGQMVSAGNAGNVPIRSIRFSFPSHDLVLLDVDAGFDTLDPFGIILASMRPPHRGMTSPQATVLPYVEPNPSGDTVAPKPPSIDWFTKVEENILPDAPVDGDMNTASCQLTYGYIQGSVEVFATSEPPKEDKSPTKGLEKLPRWTSVKTDPNAPTGSIPDPNIDPNKDPENTAIGYEEVNNVNGKINVMLPPGYLGMQKTVGADGLTTAKYGLKKGVVLVAIYMSGNILMPGEK